MGLGYKITRLCKQNHPAWSYFQIACPEKGFQSSPIRLSAMMRSIKFSC